VKIDARSDKVALHYTGNDAGEPAISGVPARDLTHNDVARLVFIDHGELHGAARQAVIDDLVERLTGGPYRITAPAKPGAPKKAAKAVAVPSPAAPAQPTADTPKEV
jgi:hypothetical protein